MATRKNSKGKVTQVTWTEEEARLGMVIMRMARKYAGDFPARVTQAARDLDPESYKHLSFKRFEIFTDLPKGTRSFMGHVGGRSSHKNDNQLQLPSSTGSCINIEALRQQWYIDVLMCSTLAHSLHPEDELGLAVSVQEILESA